MKSDMPDSLWFSFGALRIYSEEEVCNIQPTVSAPSISYFGGGYKLAVRGIFRY